MTPDELDLALDSLLAVVAEPTANAYARVLARTRRRTARRRALTAGATVGLIVAVTGIAVAGRMHRGRSDAAAPPASTVPSTTTTSTVPAPAPGPQFWTMAAVSATEAWKCVDPLEYTTDGGRNWLSVSRPPGVGAQTGNVVCAAVSGDAAWWVPTTNDPPPSEVYRVESSQRAVASPLPGVPAGGVLLELTFADAEHGWAVMSDGPSPRSDLYRTADGGRTWTIVARRARIGYAHVFTSATRGWAASGDAVLTTTDAGAHWKRARGASRPDPLSLGVQAIVAHGGSVIVWRMVQTDPTHLRPVFDISADGGRTWSRRAPPWRIPDRVNIRFDAPDAAHLRALVGTRLWVSNNGGVTWAQRGPRLPVSYVEQVRFPTANVGWILGRTAGGGSPVVLRTISAGRAWVDITYGRPLNPLPGVPGGIIGCPRAPVTPAPPPAHRGDAPPGVVAAAFAEVGPDVAGPGTTVTAVYPVGDLGAGAFGSAFADNVGSCPHPANTAFWVVELQRGNASTFIAVVLAHGPTGWHVFGRYRP